MPSEYIQHEFHRPDHDGIRKTAGKDIEHSRSAMETSAGISGVYSAGHSMLPWISYAERACRESEC